MSLQRSDHFEASILPPDYESTTLTTDAENTSPGGLEAKRNSEDVDNTLLEDSEFLPKPTRRSNIDGEHSVRTPYRMVSMYRSALGLFSIVFANTVCSLGIVFCLWGFANKHDILPWEKRAFNSLSLLLSAVLGFGIGFLSDRIGMLARGMVLQTKAHPVEHIGYIIRGSLSAYFMVFIEKPTHIVILLYLLCSICGRFGVAFLGFGYTLETNVEYTPPQLRPDWGNLTLPLRAEPSGGSIQPQTGFMNALGNSSLSPMCEFAQIAKGITQIPDDRINNATGWVSEVREAGDIRNFEIENLVMNINGTTVQYRYKYQDLNSTGFRDSPWEAVIESSCLRYNVSREFGDREENNFTQVHHNGKSLSIPMLWSNFHHTRHRDAGRNSIDPDIPSWRQTVKPSLPLPWRWIMKTSEFLRSEEHTYTNNSLGGTTYIGHISEKETWSLNSVPRGGLHVLWLMGETMFNLTPYTPDANNNVMEEFAQNQLFLFNCSFSLRDKRAEHDSKEEGLWIMGTRLYNFLRMSYLGFNGRDFQSITGYEPYDSATNTTFNTMEYYRDVEEPGMVFEWGLGRKNVTESEIWLAAYIGRYIANQLSLLNDILARKKILESKSEKTTKLMVKWNRVALVLGALLIFQIVFAISALWSCKGTFEFEDDVSTTSSVLEGLAMETEKKSGPHSQEQRTNCSGQFIQEGSCFRWVLTKHKRE